MEFEHSFTIPVPPDKAWDVLLDVQRIAPCMPGASVDSVEGDDVRGKVRVKVGPITMTYAGRARFVDRDPEAHTVTIEASGKEARGAGTAAATVHAALHGDDGQTRVTMSTSLNVTGRPAQMGRGVLADVSAKLIQQFAANLAGQLAGETTPAGVAEGPAAAAEAAEPPGGPAMTGPGGHAAAATSGPGHDHTLNLLGLAAGPVMKRILPAVGALIAAFAVAVLARIRRKGRHAS